ncbi:hypothetical protein EDWATA_00973 [Edwardsiella tarda ATCC 23685]|uniref:Uncharacterized protein n=1 Tax=Edwardsiella tarda ATCC 23685 TaxID=500638 RepID=D4F2M3_EDWTA|nr:hypothetical protein EDWATA_00973 [Edwardsiella tarda ATCC 23685]
MTLNRRRARAIPPFIRSLRVLINAKVCPPGAIWWYSLAIGLCRAPYSAASGGA